MRLAFWRSGKAEAEPVDLAIPQMTPAAERPAPAQIGELDFLAIGEALVDSSWMTSREPSAAAMPRTRITNDCRLPPVTDLLDA